MSVLGCPVLSSVSGQPCLLPGGHGPDSPWRFHRYEQEAPEAPFCGDCGHREHGAKTVQPPSFDVRCGEIVGSSGGPMPEPVYCECLDWAELVAAVAAVRQHDEGWRRLRPLPAPDDGSVARDASGRGSYAPMLIGAPAVQPDEIRRRIGG